MKRLIFILGFVCVVISSLCAQNDVCTLYEHPKVIPASHQFFYNTDSIISCDVVLDKLSKKEQVKYITNYKQQIKYMAESGQIYFNWQPVDSYLNDLLHKLTPDSLKNKIESVVFVKKDITNNAISMPNGHIYINVGLLANLKNEGALAFIIAHELAHYLKKHHLKNYTQTLHSNNKRGATYYRFKHNNKHLEIEADEIALNLLKAQNIPITGAVDVFQLLKSKGKNPNLTSMRLYFIEKQVSEITQKQDQLEQNKQFIEINLICKNEFLNILLENKFYKTCIELGLSNTNENNFLNSNYFTAEAIRRYLVDYPDSSSKTIEELFSENTKAPINIVDSFSNSVLSKKLSTVFKELTSINNKVKYPELYFTNALYQFQQTKNIALAETDIKNYLNKTNIKHAVYAKYLLKNAQAIEVEDSFKSIILVDVFTSTKQAANGFQVDFEKQNYLNEILSTKLKQWLYAKYAGSKIIFIEDLIKADFITAIELQSFFNSQDTTLTGRSYESILLSQPNTYELFNRLGASSVQYFKIETKEGLQLENESVVNPINFPSKLAYIIKEKHQFLIKNITLQPSESCSFKQNSYKGNVKINKVTNAFEQLLD